MIFKGDWAFVTGPSGLTVLDISVPAAPTIAAVHPLPHFENEDVDLCGNTVLITNDREARDLGSILYAFDISTPSHPVLVSVTPVGLTGTGRGAGHIANFVSADCSHTTPSATRRECSGRSAVAARPDTSSRRIPWRPSSSRPPARQP
jgi:hypothetical protein